MAIFKSTILVALASLFISAGALADDIQTSFFPNTSREVRVDARTVSNPGGRDVSVQPRDSRNNQKFLNLLSRLESKPNERINGRFRRNGQKWINVVYTYVNDNIRVRVKGINYVISSRDGIDIDRLDAEYED